MDTGPLLPLFLIVLFFDAVTVAVVRQGNQGSSPIIFASLIAMSAGSTAAFLLAALLPGSDRLVAVTVAATLGTLFGCVTANDLRALFACRTRVEATYRGCEDVPTAHVMTLHYPVFSYEHRGRPYHGRSIQSVSGRRERDVRIRSVPHLPRPTPARGLYHAAVRRRHNGRRAALHAGLLCRRSVGPGHPLRAVAEPLSENPRAARRTHRLSRRPSRPGSR